MGTKNGNSTAELTPQQQAVLKEKAQAARELARRHYAIDSGLTFVQTLWTTPDCDALPDTPIKLLEVNDNTIASGVMPVHFGLVAGSGVPFQSVIVEVTPEEFELIKRDELKLPAGWSMGEPLLRSVSEGGD